MKRSIRRTLALLTAVCCIGGITAGSASATSEWFYKENILGAHSAVSGVPHGTTYFVGAYTSSHNLTYCVAGYEPGVILWARQCTSFTTSVTTSFPAQQGRGLLQNESAEAGRFSAEERY